MQPPAPTEITAAPQSPSDSPESRQVAFCSVFPRLGVARVGDSVEYFLGPESPDVPPEPHGGFKDDAGRLKRQAVRFRVYGFDGNGNFVKELTAANTQSIKWSVSVANTKAAWHEFAGAAKAQGLFESTLPSPTFRNYGTQTGHQTDAP